MSTTTVNTLQEAVRTGRLQEDLEWFSRVRRDTGGPGEDRAAEYIASRLQAAGVPVTVHAFPAFLSYPISASIEVAGPDARSFPSVTHPFSRPTGPEGLTAQVVAVTPDELERARGRVALVDGLATPVTVLRASKAGCAAILFANQDRVIHNMIATTIWGTPEIDQLDRLPELPAATVNRESGEALKAMLAETPELMIRLVTDVQTGWFTSRLPEVRIPGTDGGEFFCLVGAHYCAWDVGVTDNATGDACLLEMARILWEHRRELKRGVRFCWWPGHSQGRYSGSTWYADTFFTELADGCIAYHNIDSPGVRGATWYIARHTTAEIEEFCQSMIRLVTGQQDVPIHRPARAADQSFLANGIASFSTYPFLPEDHPDRRPWTGGSANAWWWHTEHDTLDKADVEILALDTRLSLTAVFDLVTAPVLPLRFVRTAQEIAAFAGTLQSSAGDHVDLTPVLDEARRLEEVLVGLDAHIARVEPRGADARRLNALLLRLGRLLNPIVYSQRGRFAHDPAEWSPIMRATRIYTLAALGRAAGLPALKDRGEYGFLRAQVIRERNRVVTALRDARSLAADAMSASHTN